MLSKQEFTQHLLIRHGKPSEHVLDIPDSYRLFRIYEERLEKVFPGFFFEVGADRFIVSDIDKSLPLPLLLEDIQGRPPQPAHQGRHAQISQRPLVLPLEKPQKSRMHGILGRSRVAATAAHAGNHAVAKPLDGFRDQPGRPRLRLSVLFRDSLGHEKGLPLRED
jgi:hypothetical protein